MNKNESLINKAKDLLELLYYPFVVICFIVGFSPWFYWLKEHAAHDQPLLVVLDVLFVFILIPTNGFIIIIKSLLGIFFIA